MVVINCSRCLAISVLFLLLGSRVLLAQAAAPNSCSLVTPAAWSAVLSRPVAGFASNLTPDGMFTGRGIPITPCCAGRIFDA